MEQIIIWVLTNFWGPPVLEVLAYWNIGGPPII